MQSRAQRELSGEDGAAEGGGNSPEKGGTGDKEVSAEGVGWVRCLDGGPRFRSGQSCQWLVVSG
jgi:hypothetical protein